MDCKLFCLGPKQRTMAHDKTHLTVLTDSGFPPALASAASEDRRQLCFPFGGSGQLDKRILQPASPPCHAEREKTLE